MKVWDILELPRTDDISVIRQAFVDNFCAINVEYFSKEGFLFMREAYIRAVNFARTGDGEGLEMDLDDSSICMTEEIEAFILPILSMRIDALPDQHNAVIPADVINRMDDIVHLYASIMALSDDFYGKIELSSWTKLFQTDILCNPVIVNYLRLPLLKSLAANPLLPHSVWVYLDLVFHWRDVSYSIPSGLEQEKRILAIETDPRWELGFSLFRKTPRVDSGSSERLSPPIRPMWDHTLTQVFTPVTYEDVDFELYATYRRNARNSIIEGNEAEAERNFIHAADIFDKDPDLFVIYFEYLKGIKDEGKLKAITDLHLMILNRLLDFFPDTFMFLLSRVELNAISQDPSVVISEYRKLMQSFPDNLLVVYKLADTYQRLGKESDSKKCIKFIEKNYMAIQTRLKSGREVSRNPAARDEHYRMNEQVMQLLKKSREQEKAGAGSSKKRDRAG
jgi:hypothetical protein